MTDDTQGLGSVGQIPGAKMAATQGGVSGAPPAAAVQQVASATLLTKVEALLTKLDAAAKAEEAKAASTVKNFFAKHWPWMMGASVAATRFISHL